MPHFSPPLREVGRTSRIKYAQCREALAFGWRSVFNAAIKLPPAKLQPQSGDRMQPTACPEPAEEAEAVGNSKKGTTSPARNARIRHWVSFLFPQGVR